VNDGATHGRRLCDWPLPRLARFFLGVGLAEGGWGWLFGSAGGEVFFIVACRDFTPDRFQPGLEKAAKVRRPLCDCTRLRGLKAREVMPSLPRLDGRAVGTPSWKTGLTHAVALRLRTLFMRGAGCAGSGILRGRGVGLVAAWVSKTSAGGGGRGRRG